MKSGFDRYNWAEVSGDGDDLKRAVTITDAIFTVLGMEHTLFEPKRSFPRERRACGNPTYTYLY